MHDRTEQSTAQVIRHPIWCQHVAANAPLAGDPLGSPTFYDRLGVAEPFNEHEGRAYRLDAGDTFAYTISATATQWYGDDGAHQAPQVRVDCLNHEVGGSSTIYLAVAEIDRVVSMLERARREIEPSRG